MQISPVDGMKVMLDMVEPHDLTTYNRTVTIQSHIRDHCLPMSVPGSVSINVICPNTHFIQVTSPVQHALTVYNCQHFARPLSPHASDT